MGAVVREKGKERSTTVLTENEIKQFISDDIASERKKLAKEGQNYYEAEHDILSYRIFYYNADGKLVEDTTRSNVRIPHPFFTELVDQATQYILSGKDSIIKSDIPELQEEMDKYFGDEFLAELSEVVTGCQTKGFEYVYAYKNAEDRTAFMCADSLGVIEVRAKDTEDKCEYYIYWYVDRIDKGSKVIKRIQVWDKKETYFYVQAGNGKVALDKSEPINPRPHTIYSKEGEEGKFQESYGFIPFYRMDNNKKRTSALKPIKPIIDDYDLMNCGLSNNLADFDKPIHVVKGFEGDNLDELQQNLKTKKLIGIPGGETNAGLEIKTVEVPYQARLTKLQEDEKNIYRFGFGLNTSGLKDTAATTNVAIKAAYSLLDLKCAKLIINLKQFLRKLIKVALDEINEKNETDYQQKDVYFNFEPEILSNALENAQIALTEAQEQQTRITTILNIAPQLDNETVIQSICEILDINYEDIKDKLPTQEEDELNKAQVALEGVEDEEV